MGELLEILHGYWDAANNKQSNAVTVTTNSGYRPDSTSVVPFG